MFRLLATAIVKLWIQTYNAADKLHSNIIEYSSLIERTPWVLKMKM